MSASQSKSNLRREALARRAGLATDLAASFALGLAERGSALAGQMAASASGRFSVSAYWPIGAEADTKPLLAALAARGVATALPVTGARGEALLFRLWRPGDSLEPRQLGIGEPLPEAEPVEPDLLFVPLAAFDRRGNRIGYGAGHYDLTLANLRAKKPITAVGVAFSFQEIPEVPSEPHDQKLDFVLTEREWIDCRGDGRR